MSLRHYIRFARSVLLRDRPIYVHVALTDQCDLRCRACTIWRREKPMESMTIGRIRRLAEVLNHLGCIQVSLGGGEPALRKDLPEVVDAFLKQGIRTRVLTNGVAMTPEIADSLLSAGLREVSFSLDSLDPKYQESLDGQKGSYQIRMENLISLAEKMSALKSIPVLNTMVTPENIEQLPSILLLAEKIGFAVSFIPIHLNPDTNGDHRFYSDDRRLRFAKEDEAEVKGIYRRIIEAKGKGAPIVNSTPFLAESPGYLLTGQTSWPCLAGRSYLSVSPDGKVTPCHIFEGDKKWSIDFEDFPARFRTSAYRYELRRLTTSCEGCFRPCWAEISYMVTDFHSMAEMAWLQLTQGKSSRRFEADAVREWIAGQAEGPS